MDTTLTCFGFRPNSAKKGDSVHPDNQGGYLGFANSVGVQGHGESKGGKCELLNINLNTHKLQLIRFVSS